MAVNSLERTVVTGLGTFSAAGGDLPSLWKSALAGRSPATTRSLASLNQTFPVYAAGGKPFVTARERRLCRHADRTVELALHAANEAWQMAQLDRQAVDSQRIGLVVGSSRGPVAVHEVARQRPSRPSDSAYTTVASISGVIAAALEIEGASMMVSATCVSAAAALKTAQQMIQAGELDVALVGGVDAPLVAAVLEQFAATDVLATDALRPFDRHRSGTVLGEGAAFLVLESESSARRRAVTARGSIQHVAIGCDSDYRTGGDRSGKSLRFTAEKSLRHLALDPRRIDLVHLHGTGTKLNDVMESQCVRKLFGPEAQQPWIWASKGLTGHTLGASPLFQVALTLEAMRHSFIPGTANCAELDPDCPLRLSLGNGAEQRVTTALCLTSGFWGNTSCVVVGR